MTPIASPAFILSYGGLGGTGVGRCVRGLTAIEPREHAQRAVRLLVPLLDGGERGPRDRVDLGVDAQPVHLDRVPGVLRVEQQRVAPRLVPQRLLEVPVALSQRRRVVVVVGRRGALAGAAVETRHA
eukprot:6085585-Prymnesium_polylepis.1